MKLTPADPDIETIMSRVKKSDIDLQPSFQRGEVWSDSKKVKLIDTILRQWHIPPIHLVQVKETGRLQVLDGQQRLAAIRDFVNGRIRVKGDLAPPDDNLAQLNGLTYGELPDDVRRRFDQFTIRVFSISDYAPEEPGELFFRLNQPVTLTTAEQRNAFFGPVREQVKRLVSLMPEVGLSYEFIGFNNSRMAFDDVIARLCIFLESGSLSHKVTAGLLADRYRNATPFSEDSIVRVEYALQLLGRIARQSSAINGFNKATLFTWLWFLASVDPCKISIVELTTFFDSFEASRRSNQLDSSNIKNTGAYQLPVETAASNFFVIFNDRSAARVNDTSSVLARDIVIWLMLLAWIGPMPSPSRYDLFKRYIFECQPQDYKSCEAFITKLITESSWASFA